MIPNETLQAAWRRLAQTKMDAGYKAEARHDYKAADGSWLYSRIRLKHPETGDKYIRPIKLNGHGYEFGEPKFPEGKPLYNLDKIAADAASVVWIVEGEKAADALTNAGLLATTSGGADSADMADWSPLHGRSCRLWPDNDEAGTRYMANVAERLSALGCNVATIEVAQLNLPPKADAVEWLELHLNASPSDFDALPVSAPQPVAPSATEADLAGPTVNLIRGDTVHMQPVAWLWDGYLAQGKMHIVAGAPGTGKTTLAVALAATATQGGRWPDGTRAPTGDVLIWSGEDGIEDTLAPRLRASGADMARVHFVGDVQDGVEPVPFDPARHFAALALAASRLPNLRMMIVDPIVSAVAGDSHQNAEVRRGLAPLVTFAEQAGCALVGISHFTKGTQGRDPLERVTGSLGFGALARIVFGTAKLSEEDGGGRVLVRLKSNLGPDTGGGFKYELRQVELDGAEAGITTTRVEWCGSVEGSAREILASAEQVDEAGHESPKDFLRDLLSAGPMKATDIFRDADGNGFSKDQMKRAKSALGVVADKLGMQDGWQWSLPKGAVTPEGSEESGQDYPHPSHPSALSSAETVPEEVI